MRFRAGGGHRVPGLAIQAVVAVCASALTAGLAAPAAAVAAGPVQPGARAAAAVVAAAVPEASQEEKVRAAAVLGIVAGDDLLILSDRDFVFEIWKRAAGKPVVRADAEAAISAGAAACTQFIRTGIFAANEQDQANELRDATEKRLAREAKASAAATIGIVAEPELLALSDRDFSYELWRRATGPRVKTAALAAFGGTAAEQKAFIESGVRTAHEQDQREAIEADEQASAAEKARRAAEDAKSRAAAVLGIVATREVLVLSDENFVRLIWNRSTAGTEVNAAAQAALRSADPADWKEFIDSGIYAANRRDIAEALRRQAEQDRRLAREIQAKAENSLVHPRLAEAARTALAGSDADVDRFLRVGQYQALTQSLRATTNDRRPHYVQSGGGDARLIEVTSATPLGDATWKIVAGLADPDCHSMESADHPGSYLRHQDGRVRLTPNDGSAAFKNDATWCARPGLAGSGVSLESRSAPGRFLRHVDAEIWAANGSREHWYDRACSYAANATWRIEGPNPNPPMPPGTYPPVVATDPCLIVNENSGMCIGVAGGSTERGAAVIQWDCQEQAPNQNWSLRRQGPGEFWIRNKNGFCLGVGNNRRGTQLVQWRCDVGVPNQVWMFDREHGRIVNKQRLDTGEPACMGVSGGSRERGARIVQWHCDGSANQNWRR